MKKLSVFMLTLFLLSSCVAKKKYVELEEDRNKIESQLFKSELQNKELEDRFAAIEKRVDNYNAKINSLKQETDALQKESDAKLTVSDGTVISTDTKRQMRNSISKMDPNVVAGARTLKDSMNLVVSHNLQKTLYNNDLGDDSNGDIAININETVVMITIADNLIFKTASYKMSNKADGILQKIADLLASEPSLDLMVEGHTDPRTISTACLKDNWDLSVLRATSIVRTLEKKFNVDPSKLIASGRSSHQPLVGNETKEDRAKNRRTRIVIMPNIDKFFALMAEKE